MANRKGLGVSKKFFNGSVHENGTGKFMVLNRYEGEDGLPWLEFQWLSGEKEGQAESNKEINMNASIHKFKTTRRAAGLEPVTPVQQHTDEPISLHLKDTHNTMMDQMMENTKKFDHMVDLLNEIFGEMLPEFKRQFQTQEKQIQRLIEEVQRIRAGVLDVMHEQQTSVSKLIERLPKPKGV